MPADPRHYQIAVLSALLVYGVVAPVNRIAFIATKEIPVDRLLPSP